MWHGSKKKEREMSDSKRRHTVHRAAPFSFSVSMLIPPSSQVGAAVFDSMVLACHSYSQYHEFYLFEQNITEGAMSVIEFSDPKDQRAYEKRKKNLGIVYWILAAVFIGCCARSLLFR